MCDKWESVLEDLRHFRQRTERLGLTLNPSKCELRCFGPNGTAIFDAFNTACPGIKFIARKKCTL